MRQTLTIEFDRWIDKAEKHGMSISETAGLAERLGRSGQTIPARRCAMDLASTGGPASLSTLYSPAVLVAQGAVVPKLAVPGRPAGGIDSLGQIPGYRTSFSKLDALKVIEECGYVHMLAGEEFAPADAAMFRRRQEVGAQANASLAIASLLAKKVAVGVMNVGLEVRVASHGNFGRGLSEARANSSRFIHVAQSLGMKAICFLVDGMLPQQPYIGRGEAVLALSSYFEGRNDKWLERHLSTCEAWASQVTLSSPVSKAAIKHAFAANLSAQGGDFDDMHAYAERIRTQHARFIESPSDGWVSYKLAILRDAILKTRGADAGGSFLDTAGVILLVEPGDKVRRGQPVISIRCSEQSWPDFKKAIEPAVSVLPLESDITSLFTSGTIEVISV